MKTEKDVGGNKRCKVLVADDSPAILKGLCQSLEKWGYEPVCASNGEDAWELLHADNEIRLAVLDCNMPGLDGMQLCRRLRVERPAPYVYVLMFSTHDEVENQVKAIVRGGVDDFLPKPSKPVVLRAKLLAAQRLTALMS